MAIDTALRTDAPLRRLLIVAEPDALTIAEMITSLRRGLDRRPGLLPIPAPLLRYVFGILGRAVRADCRLACGERGGPMGSQPWRELRVKLKGRVSAQHSLAKRVRALGVTAQTPCRSNSSWFQPQTMLSPARPCVT